MHRFFLPPEIFRHSPPSLTGLEAHHCLNTLRLPVGEHVTVFNGRGSEAKVTISCIKKDKVLLSSLTRLSFTPRPPVEITLAQAIPKARSMGWIIQKAVELGAARVAPLISERTVVQIDSREGKRKQSRWERIAIRACEQCGRNWLPHILQPSSLEEFLQSIGTKDFLLIASLQPDACRLKEVLASYLQKYGKPRHATILVGPEGDFTLGEIALAKGEGCQPVTLGPIVLRTETAAIYCLSVLSHELGLCSPYNE
ncbi:Ribosomal RNA small subunit methyltransferase E [Candidatus Xiphinematobacter sp. Idaho Grape]|uniref:16S rRNA (uracil(1498)-N(3))-methyltransferase n=1 Tax=Candidatus Xiphinematobacter sp. Idaho Grape TaxID=1704307 RepID=UPI000706A24B|nr:16S rRNA (uracil(1498)-N(3))-methyltransferase [Candidatus Xiphinematobacter sp. Idaho Grape]ALJ56634.1 Ribosomal RNA small subunit methyltransferase E [Candidatus Xiphinematobacter sp. Idaho Grape]